MTLRQKPLHHCVCHGKNTQSCPPLYPLTFIILYLLRRPSPSGVFFSFKIYRCLILSYMLVSDLKRGKKYIAGLPGDRVARSRDLVVSHYFSIFSYNFQDFYKLFFAKCSQEVCLKRLQSGFLIFCLQKIWHTDQVGVPKKVGFFSKHKLCHCAKFFVGKNSKIRFDQILDKPLTSILQKTVCKNLENCRRR